MRQYVIEREIPGAGNLTDAELQAVARTSVGVLRELGRKSNGPFVCHGR